MVHNSGVYAGLFYQTFFFPAPAPAPAPADVDVRAAAPVPLILLPGLLADGRQLRRLVRDLRRPALVVDPLGSGRSEAPAAPAAYALPEQAERLLALLAALGIARADLLGLSMGGMWAQHALLRATPRFRAGLLVATSARTEPRLRSIVLSLQAQRRCGLSRLDLWRSLQTLMFAPQFLDRPEVIPMLETLASEQTTAEHAVLGQLAALLEHDLSAQLHQVPQVRLVLAGELDWLTPPGVQQRLVQALGYGTPQLLAGAGHALWIEQPAALAAALRAALPDPY